MKKTYLFVVQLLITVAGLAQNNTNLPSGSGNAGTDNVSIGNTAGDVTTGVNNVFVGSKSGLVSQIGSNNVFVGFASGYSNTTGNENVFLGNQAGYLNTTGQENTYLGSESGQNNITGIRNTFVGHGAGFMSTSSENSFVGHLSGRNLTTGTQNTFFGVNSGLNIVSGSGNVFLGYNAGYNELGSNKLYIDNSNTPTPLIYGNFSSNQLGVNALPNSTHALTVGGTVYATGLSTGVINATGIYVNGSSISGDLSFWTKSGSTVYNTSDNIGIGKSNPTQKLDVNGIVNASAFYVNGAPFAGGGSQWATSGTSIFYNGGVVGIGTLLTPSGYKLAIGGKAIAEEIVIMLQSIWPDYVFNEEYKLPPLKEVEAFIKLNNHLPEIPSSKEIEKTGAALGEMNVILLKKIEELTLYSIEQNKTIETQETLLTNQARKIIELENKMNEILKAVTK